MFESEGDWRAELLVEAQTQAFSDDELLTMVQEASFRVYRERVHPQAGTALEPLLEYLDQHPKIRIIGPTDLIHRAPTVSVIAEGIASPDLVTALTEYGVMSGYGHFYAARLLEALGIDLETGVTRFSFVHYTSEGDVEQLVGGLEQVL